LAIWGMRLVRGSCYRAGVVQRSGSDESRSLVGKEERAWLYKRPGGWYSSW
jgi:hypothetical protein